MSETGEVLVSIIIPIYNVEKYIQKCIESVLNQTWKNLEIICVNDDTPDHSMDIVKEKAESDDRIIMISIKNSGLSVARNTGIEASTGKYIYFLDSDDYIADDAIEQLVNCAEDNQTDVVFFNAESIFESEDIARKQANYATYYKRNGKYTGVSRGEELFIDMMNNRDFKPSACLLFINRNFMESAGLRFYPGILHEDNLFTLQMIQKAQRAMVFEQPLYKRLIRESSITSGKKNIYYAYGFFVCQREIMAFLAENNCSLAFYSALKIQLDIMKRNAVKALKGMSLEDISGKMAEIDSAAVFYFIDYIYDLYWDQRNMAIQNQLWPGKYNHIPGGVKKYLKKVCNRINRVRNKIVRGIPAPIRWFVRTVYRFGLGYFCYRKKISKDLDKVCVSIIVPVYNAERYLRQNLDSLLNQKLRNIEIICVDDGSTDHSKEILQEYQKKDSRIKVFCQDNEGAGAARNHGMKAAVGEYLLFLDADDIFDENLCNEAYYQSIRKKADICLFGARRHDMKTLKMEPMNWVLRTALIPKRNLFSGKSIKGQLFQITTGCPWSKMFKRQFVIQNGLEFQNLTNTNDAYFVRMSMALADRITTVNRCFVTYRYNEGTNIQSRKARDPLAFYEAFKAIKVELQKRGIYEDFEQTYCNMVLKESLFNLKTAGTETAKAEIKYLLKTEAIDFYGLKKHPESYYYDRNEYSEIKEFF